MHGKKLGVVMLVVGLLSALSMYFVRESNQPVRVSSSLGSGYMTDGWGDALTMFNVFIVLGIIMAVIGLVLIIAAKKD